LRNLGSIKKNLHKFIGLNSRLDTIQAVVLKRKLRSIKKINDKRREIAAMYDKGLSKVNGITLTCTNPGSSRHLYVIRSSKRNDLIKYLNKKGILCQIHYPYCLNKIKPFIKNTKKNISLKNSEKWSKECLSLPLHPLLKSNEITKVINEIKNYFKHK